ncbi:ESF2 [Candida theae]|uniref:Pre-rRNA-processing protein ESF2 n=1 Tax=Candida theae TaxID=1198502 RepID=A0AAD5FX79_9ASCO|nr:ESF2 [Candida theae]KAI5950380.1 ESF2 [Candida theae]
MSDRDLQPDFFSDDESDQEHQVFLRSKAKRLHAHTTTTDEAEGEEESDFGSEDEEENFASYSNHRETDNQDVEDDEHPQSSKEQLLLGDNDASPASTTTSTTIINKKLKKLTPKELEKEQKRIKKTGVCYLSKIPPYMKPAKLRSVLSRFGSIDRIFLKPEDASIYHKRVKYGGNKKKRFTEGWIEFVNKKDAKLCAQTLNGNKLGGKKTSYYYDDIINIKYLSGFKWMDLTQQIAKENEVRQAKLVLDLSQQNKFNKAFVHNVEQSKMIEGIKRKRSQRDKEKEPGEGEDTITASDKKNNSKNDDVSDTLRRHFKQRKVTSTRSDASSELKEKSAPNDRLANVLSKVL